MLQAINAADSRDLLTRGFSRRSFGRFASLLGAGSALPFYNECALAQTATRSMGEAIPKDAVRMSGNENPIGPCPEAREAIYKVAGQAGRYEPNGEYTEMIEVAASVDGVKPAYAGSADPLHRTICAFVSPAKSLVLADSGYEAPERAAQFLGAKMVKVPLKKDKSHDGKAMVAADPNAGVIREDVFNFPEQNRFTYVRSQSNFFMLDVKQPGKDVAMKMAKQKVLVGRTWPAWPTYSRITVGTADGMSKFKSALIKVMA